MPSAMAIRISKEGKHLMKIGSRVVLIVSALAVSLGLLLAPDTYAQQKKDTMGKDDMMKKEEMKKDAMGKDSMKKDDMMKKKDEMKK
jgi:pentapeptide MXKDX repeat protein